ncbi:ABC transporter ATP-binding protein [Bordetella genomosp. 9]|uniref:Glycerol-3-phosphate ABC transporter ATP-binding protein n=1 Tax=Bordetella genomosp. 9 TaxID=1416803 RepID=A0A1W6Z2N8_9BORD|nr:sn-glycerol-3-phosphate ABC transporter ATP-binding protein UgpC [Bordetella genomosp. 9]ARP87546.1 glycerol-3-phosphate ABC transporter ATP-binding protein [Bordetella genomosp. 9]ARP91520.1 glycerol-3-phosphate ABC transporter ATP-binding protein [Bordetella genomosp. 9]
MASIRLHRLMKTYGGNTVIPALDLEVRDREFMVFVGPSGCGKSTLLRIIAGLETVDDGDIYIGERRVNDVTPAQRDISMVFQDYALYPHMTVRQNMAFSLEMRGLGREEIARRVQRAAAMLRIEEYLDRKPRALSGGQRQRVAMGRAMVRDPKVFLFDEPLSNLDAKLRGEVRTEIKALAQTLQTTMIFVTHDQVEAMTMADRIVVLKGGVIQQVGAPEHVYANPVNQFVASFIGSPTMNFFQVTVDADGIALRDGSRIPLPADLLAALHAQNVRQAVLGLRPEHLRIAPEGGGALRAQACVVEPLGADTLVHFDGCDGRHVVRVDPRMRVRPGDTLELDFPADCAHFFHGEDGRNVRRVEAVQ